MQTDYIAHFEHKQAIRKNIFCGFLLLLLVGIPLWFYIDSYLETIGIGIDNLGVERYDQRMKDAFIVTLILMGSVSVIAVPGIIFINNFFNRYQRVLQQLTRSEIETLKTINDALYGIDKYMPSFIITSQILYVFSFQQYVIPFNRITAHKISIRHVKNGFMYKIEINTSDGQYYNFSISSNQIQLEQLKLSLQG